MSRTSKIALDSLQNVDDTLISSKKINLSKIEWGDRFGSGSPGDCCQTWKSIGSEA